MIVLCVNTLSPMHGLHNIIAHTNGKVLLVSILNAKCHEVTLKNKFLVTSDKDSLGYTSNMLIDTSTQVTLEL